MRLPALLSVGALLLAACGDDGGSTPPVDSAPGEDSTVEDGGTIDTPAGTFTLTSTAYTEGGVIPLAHVCTRDGGMNQSPPLAWTNPPAGTMSFAIVFTDKSNNLIHSGIYDIPAATTSLPQDVDKMYSPADVAGAHQVRAFNGTFGYAGPCPPNQHTYEMKIYALESATLSGATMNTTTMQLVNLVGTNLGTATLTGTHTPP